MDGWTDGWDIAGRSAPLRLALRDRRGKVRLGAAFVAEGDAAPRAPAHQRVVQNRSANAIRRPR